MSDPKSAGKKEFSGAEPLVPRNVKKVRPYPFKCSLEQGAVKKTVDIVYVGLTGFIARTGAQFVHVGDHYQAVFELPTLHEFINTPVRVLKTYDKAVDSKVTKVARMAEFHFDKLIDDHRARITQFITAIGQAK